MGTEIYTEKDMYVKRFYGGEDKGVSFIFDMDNVEMTQEEMLKFIGTLLEYIML
jgi:hypothetical protein